MNQLTRSTTFRYPCYRQLKKRLGEADAAAQFAEIAVRELSAQLQRSPDSQLLLEKMAHDHAVKTDYVDQKLARRQLSQLHIVAVLGEFEQFLENLRESHPDRLSWSYNKDEKEALLVRIIRNLSPSIPAARNRLGTLDYDLHDYYRLLRNRVAHGEDDAAGISSKAAALRGKTGTDSDYKRLAAPNDLNNVGFDDFILCTRVAKRLARALCQLARPTDLQIAEMVNETLATPAAFGEKARPVPNLRALRDNRKRQHSALTTFLRQEYSIDKEEAQPIVELLLCPGLSLSGKAPSP